MNPLIISAAIGYKPDQVSTFVQSIKRSGFQGSTAFLVRQGDTVLQEYFAQNGIRSIPIDSPPRWMPNSLAVRRFNHGGMALVHRAVAKGWSLCPSSLRSAYAAQIAAPFHNLVSNRLFYYFRYIKLHSDQFSHVFITDARDVVFQADPFHDVPARFLWLFQENKDCSLGDEGPNREWIKQTFGPAELERLSGFPILCAGTTLGSTDLILSYLEKMTGALVRLTPRIAGQWGPDQVVHNHLYWTGELREAEVKKNFQGPVVTLLLESPDQFRFDASERLLNHDDTPIAVIHQYDRHPVLIEKLTALTSTL